MQRAENRRAGARIIEKQLQEREQTRQQEAELRRKESEALTRVSIHYKSLLKHNASST